MVQLQGTLFSAISPQRRWVFETTAIIFSFFSSGKITNLAWVSAGYHRKTIKTTN
jgi:hypothetical protein